MKYYHTDQGLRLTDLTTLISLQNIIECSSGVLRCEYGSHIISNFMAAISFENNNSLGNLLSPFNTDIDCSWSSFCCTDDDSILANIWNVIASYHCCFTDGIFIFNSFHTLALLKIEK